MEDEETHWLVSELNLRKRFKMAWAKNDEEACAFVRQHGPELHAVLMDVQLKGSRLDGIALTRVLRGRGLAPVPDYAEGLPVLECPIFIVTAFARYPAQVIDEAGADAQIAKPVDFFKLAMLLAQSAGRRALHRLSRPR